MSAAAPARCQPAPLRVLLIEDSPADAELTLAALRRDAMDVSSDLAQSRESIAAALRDKPYDIILADYHLPNFRGMETLDILRELGLNTPLILMTGAMQTITAVECVKQGASDYILKENLNRLPHCIRRALEEARLREESKLAQEELATKVAELARSNADLEQFAYVASHDLQEPLRMVSAYTQLLAKRYSGQLDATADKYIGYAVEGATRMHTLIADLLAFSRVGRKRGEPEAIECDRVVDEAVRNLAVALQESRAVLRRSPLPQVCADHVELLQLFQNLIGNAIKFRGTRAPKIHLSAERHQDHWSFAVSDNGIGIAPEHSEDIFKAFHRLHLRSEYTGNGVGLAICKKIVEQRGGRIWVESVVGKGATFRFTFPLKSADGACSDENYT